MTIQDKAHEAYEWFETATRGDGSSYVRTKDGRPEWVQDLVFTAHGEFMPDDWRYRKIVEALEFIADNEAPEDTSYEFADGAVDVYTSLRLAWLASNLNRASYCDEAIENGMVDAKAGVSEIIGAGQYEEAGEIFGLVLSELEKYAGEA
jgi:hypothetical protein